MTVLTRMSTSRGIPRKSHKGSNIVPYTQLIKFMKIMIVGSTVFAKEMLEVKEQLQALGHKVETPSNLEEHVADPTLRDNLALDKELVSGKNVMHVGFERVEWSDAVLVLNYDHKGIEGYIGASALMEIGVAGYLRKKIFVLNPIASDQRYTHEIDVLGGQLIDGDLSKIR